MINNNLIFDLGFHNGDDTNFYLSKGYDVVAVEANPDLVRDGLNRLNSYIKTGQLILLNNAIHEKNKKDVDFYIHPEKTDWSSCLIDMFKDDIHLLKHITVDSINLFYLYINYGVPYYLKVDIEGCDLIVAKHLSEFKQKPKHVSFELSRNNYIGIFSYLYISGYSKFQLVNQRNNPNRIIPKDMINDKHNNFKFSKFSSGFFGEDLPKEKWLSFDEMITNYVKFKDLKIFDNAELALGWLDVHAK